MSITDDNIEEKFREARHKILDDINIIVFALDRYKAELEESLKKTKDDSISAFFLSHNLEQVNRIRESMDEISDSLNSEE